MVMLPGHRVDIYSLAEYTALEAAAEANGFILVYAEQEWRKGSFRWAWWTDWNWVANPSSNPDIQFMRDLVSDVGAGWNIDLNRVYAVGHSRGGAMAFILALEAPDLFAAVCSQSGFTEFGYDQRAQAYKGTRRTPVMLVHGTLDSDVQVGASDKMNSILSGLGWTDAELVYLRLENVAHRWQPWLNQQMWDFLSAQSLDGMESP
jgi:poly(3-hydroxybutyrate) depolymerase